MAVVLITHNSIVFVAPVYYTQLGDVDTIDDK